MTKNTLNILSIIFNYIIFFIVIFAWVFMMTQDTGPLKADGLGSLRYFTVLSNLYFGITSFVLALLRTIKLIKNDFEIKRLPIILYFTGLVSVMITFIIVITILAPSQLKAGGHFYYMYLGSNFFFHLLVPLFGLIVYIFIEQEYFIKIYDIFYSVIPVLLYGIFYILNFYLKLSPDGLGSYDWYNLIGKGEVSTTILLVLGFIVLTYIMSLIFFLSNKGINKLRIKHNLN